MPSTKRRRPATTAGDDEHPPRPFQTATSASLAGFISLPLELRQLIIEVACLTSSSSSSSLSPFEADNGTMFNLALVCKETNTQVTQMLWATVSITRPSALYALQQALLVRPERANMIRSLHIGPQITLPSYWWPLSRTVAPAALLAAVDQNEVSPSSHWIASSLQRESLPSGCESRAAWRWDRGTPGCRGAAIFEALQVIKDTLGLDFTAHGCASPTTIAPVFEAQAALDLYLDRLRRDEEINPELVRTAKPGARVPLPCRNGRCNHYPALFISGAPKSARSGLLAAQRPPPPAEPPNNAFIISYTELLCHIARPGSITDRFDHPLALARSHFNVIINVPAAKRFDTTYRPSNASYKLYSGTWDVRQHEVGQWAGRALLLEAGKQAEEEGRQEDQRRFAATVGTATFGSILRLARDVIDLTTNVQNLSLTGYLESAIFGKAFNSSLRRLSLGPALPCWDATLPVDNLKGVEELRICGRTMSAYESWTIAVKMLNLKKMVWSLAEPWKGRQSLADVMDFLLTRGDGISSADTSTPTRPGEPTESSSDVGAAGPPPLIIARLHHTDIVKLLRTAASDEIKAAWLAGRLTPGTRRRLLVRENREVFAVGSTSSNEASTGSDSSSSPIWEVMYREGREYWRVGEAEYVEGEKREHGEQEEEKEDEVSQ